MVLYQSIKFTAVGLDGLIKTTFELGLGPCGRVVTELYMGCGDKWITIIQTSFPPGFEGKQDHREIKEFLYKIRDVRGRIMATQVVSKY